MTLVSVKKKEIVKNLPFDRLLYKVYLRLKLLFLPLLVLIYNMRKHGNIPPSFTRDVVKLLLRVKHGGDGINHFWPLAMLNKVKPLVSCAVLSVIYIFFLSLCNAQ